MDSPSHISCKGNEGNTLTKLSLNRGSYMSAQVLFNLVNELEKTDKMRGLPSILSFLATSLINSTI